MIIRLINEKKMANLQIKSMFHLIKDDFLLAQQRWIRQQFDETLQEDKKRALIILSQQYNFNDLSLELQRNLNFELNYNGG